MSIPKTTQPPETRSGGHQPPAGAGQSIVHLGDCIEVMRGLPANRFHCVVTSPPYFGLRDYGTARWEGGDPACQHSGVRLPGPNDKSASNGGSSRDPVSRDCVKCGATRIDRQIGLEETPELFVARLVDVFREVRRILRDDGVVWCNMGDSYSTSPVGTFNGGSELLAGRDLEGHAHKSKVNKSKLPGIKPKDLIGVPWMLAFALRADGWYLRSDVIWHKPSVMPESVTDRPTKSHEYIFLLTKNARYYYDAEAIKEPTVNDSLPGPNMTDTAEVYGTGNDNSGLLALRRNYIANGLPSTRNKRTVWTIPSQGWDEAHFATYPPALVEPCIKAGTSERGCCAECGAPWIRIVDRERKASRPGTGSKVHGLDNLTIGNRDPQRHVTESRTVGWKASCECGAAVVPCRVFDPFTGSGTTLAVANQLGRDAEGSELNPEYKAMAERRIGRANKPNTFRDESKVEASGLFSNASEQP